MAYTKKHWYATYRCAVQPDGPPGLSSAKRGLAIDRSRDAEAFQLAAHILNGLVELLDPVLQLPFRQVTIGWRLPEFGRKAQGTDPPLQLLAPLSLGQQPPGQPGGPEEVQLL